MAATRWLSICIILYFCLFAGLTSFGLVGPDEPRYASIAREMARSGDWVTPRLNGSPWFEKPPLYYWSAAVGFRLFSIPELAARIPSGIFALAAILGLLWIARRIYGPPVAYAAGWMLPTTVAVLGFAHAAATDMPFAACLTLAMGAAAALLLDDSPTHPRLWAAVFGVVLGLAVLAKGPAGIILAGGSTALWALATQNIRRSFRLLHPAAIGAFLLVALPWYVLCAMRNAEFLRVFLLEHNVERFLTNRYQHQQPFWFYVPILLVAIFPWTLLLVPALGDAWRAVRAGSWRQLPAVFFAAWVIFPFVFFSASQSKLPGYIVPIVPPLVLLLSDAAISRGRRNPKWTQSLALLIGISLIAVGLSTVVTCRFFPGRLPPEVTAPFVDQLSGPRVLGDIALNMIVLGLVLLGLPTMKDNPAFKILAPLVLIVVNLLGVYAFLGLIDSRISPRAVAMATRIMATPGEPVRTYHLARAWQYGLDFYLHGPVPQWTPGTPRPSWIITDDAGRAQLAGMGWNLEPMAFGSAHATLFPVK